MTTFILILIITCGCLGACWAIFHVKKQKKNKGNAEVVETKAEPEATEDKNEIKEDIKLTKNSKFKIVKTATLAPKIERVFQKEEHETEEEPVVTIRNTEVKPKKAVGGDAAKSIERVFSGKKESEEVKEEIKCEHNVKTEPKRTPSISDRIEFRNHLDEIYKGFATGVKNNSNVASEIEKLQNEEMVKNVSTTFSDVRRSSMFATYFNQVQMGDTEDKKSKKINMKDVVLADTIMNRPRLSKNFKKVEKK